MTMQHVLVATDLTDASDMALERTLAVCCRDCNVTLLHVLRAGLPNSLSMQLHTLIDGYLADHALYSAGSGSNKVQPLVVTGHPFTTIVSEAVSRRAQLIVMGEPALLRRAQLLLAQRPNAWRASQTAPCSWSNVAGPDRTSAYRSHSMAHLRLSVL